MSLRGLLLAAYLPLGVALLCARLGLVVALCAMCAVCPVSLSSWVIHSLKPLLFPLCGLFVRYSCGPGVPQPKDMARVVLACNHTTAFDILPFFRLCQPSVLLDKSFFESSLVVRQFLDVFKAIRLPALDSDQARQAFRKSLRDRLAQLRSPLVFFPEGWDSACVGLLRYHKHMFTLGIPVLPVTLRARVLLLPLLQPGMLGSSVLRELLWLFFVPGTLYTVHFLPEVSRAGDAGDRSGEGSGEGDAEAAAAAAAARAQAAAGAALGIPCTAYTKHDALALRRRLAQDPALRFQLLTGTYQEPST